MQIMILSWSWLCFSHSQPKGVKNMLKVIVWFLVINFSIYNTIFTEPLSMFWAVVLEIVAMLISIYMATK